MLTVIKIPVVAGPIFVEKAKTTTTSANKPSISPNHLTTNL